MGGRTGVGALRDASADVVIVDAFAGGRVPEELTSREFVAQVARVLRTDGVVIYNVADGPPLRYTRRLGATLQAEFPDVLLRADPAVLKGRRFGNVVLAASRAGLPVAEMTRAAAAAMFPHRLLVGAEFDRYVGGAAPLTDADALRSPVPPDALWRVGD
jgi:spermidine synthase